MQILSAASAFPAHYYPQEVLLAALQQYWGDEVANPAVFQRLHRNVGVDGRYLSLPIDVYPGIKSWGEFNNHWMRTAVERSRQELAWKRSCAGC